MCTENEERSGWVSDGGQEIAWIDHKANFLLSLLNRAKGKEKLRVNLFFFFFNRKSKAFLRKIQTNDSWSTYINWI